MRNEIDFEIGTKRFRIPEISPQKGCFWSKRLIAGMDTVLDMPFNEFKELQYDFLKDVIIILESGKHRLYNELRELQDGNVNGPELLELTMASISHSMSPFFDKAMLERMGSRINPLLLKLGMKTSSGSQSEQSSGDNANSGTEHTESVT